MKLLADFQIKYPNYEVIYLTISGSKLYGTDGPTSDTDYKGIFVPPINDILLKKDIEHYTTTTGSNSSKNGEEDIDIQLWSIHKFLNLVSKGETGALDLLFSMSRSETILLQTTQSRTIHRNIPNLLHKSVHSFLGYCIGQSKRYAIKGARYAELTKYMKLAVETDISLEDLASDPDYKYISIVQAPGPRGNKGQGDIPYLSVLGKKFDLNLDRSYILEKLDYQLSQYGNRTQSASSGTDYKALSHAVRVLLEVTELLRDNTITFPLPTADYIKSIKVGNENVEDVLQFITISIDNVDTLLEASTLPETISISTLDNLLLGILKTVKGYKCPHLNSLK